MDRVTVYPAEIPLTEDMLEGQRAPYIGIGHLANLVLEGSPAASGFGLTISGLQITVAPGAVYAMGQVDTVAYGELPADTSPLMRQYLSAAPTPLIASASASSYIYAVLSTVDTDAAVLPFYNAADPSQTFSGPSNSGEALPTRRRDVATIAIGAGIPPGAIPLWEVTADAATATAVKAPAAPFYPSMVAVASRIVAPYDAQLAAAMGGYPLNAVVADPVTAGVFWVSTVPANVSVPGAEGAGWQSLFSGYATQAWANGQFLQLNNSSNQTVIGSVTLAEGIEYATDYKLQFQSDGNQVIYYNGNAIYSINTKSLMYRDGYVDLMGTTEVLVPDITDFTGKNALNAETAEARYAAIEWVDSQFLQLNDPNTQTVSGKVAFNSDIHLKTSGDGGTPQIYYDRNGIPAFSMGVDDSGNMFLSRYDSANSGLWLGEPITINGGTGAITISSTITVPTPTDYTQKQAIGASDADARYVRRSGDNTLTGNQEIVGDLGIESQANSSVAGSYNDSTITIALAKRFGYSSIFGLREVVDQSLQAVISVYNGTSWSEFDFQHSSSGGRITTPNGTVALTSELPTAGVISGGTYTKTPMNDGTGRSVLRQTFSVMVTPDSNGEATVTFPIAYSVIPNVVGLGSVEMSGGDAGGIVVQRNTAGTGLLTTTTSVPLHFWFGNGSSTLPSMPTITVEGIVS